MDIKNDASVNRDGLVVCATNSGSRFGFEPHWSRTSSNYCLIPFSKMLKGGGGRKPTIELYMSSPTSHYNWLYLDETDQTATRLVLEKLIDFIFTTF